MNIGESEIAGAGTRSTDWSCLVGAVDVGNDVQRVTSGCCCKLATTWSVPAELTSNELMIINLHIYPLFLMIRTRDYDLGGKLENTD